MYFILAFETLSPALLEFPVTLLGVGMDVLRQTLETVFHRNIQTPRRE